MPAEHPVFLECVQLALDKQKTGEPLDQDDFLLLFARQILISYSHQERGYV